MAKRGAYAKGVAKREEILDTALDLIERNGYSNTTIQELAIAVDLSKTAVLHYFGSKANLLTEVVRHSDQQALEAAGADSDSTATSLSDIRDRTSGQLTQRARDVPGYYKLFASMTVEATAEDHVGHAYFADRYAEAQKIFAALIQEAAPSSSADPAMVAVLVSAVSDGLLTQWLYNRDLDMGEHLKLFWELIERGLPATPST